ncbi:hypothetical protein HDU96_000487 [Phlyctochytrium bullatum]|nr:hypothetical protein HDU96_000487 [Phlyctochytrium bullatum]
MKPPEKSADGDGPKLPGFMRTTTASRNRHTSSAPDGTQRSATTNTTSGKTTGTSQKIVPVPIKTAVGSGKTGTASAGANSARPPVRSTRPTAGHTVAAGGLAMASTSALHRLAVAPTTPISPNSEIQPQAPVGDSEGAFDWRAVLRGAQDMIKSLRDEVSGLTNSQKQTDEENKRLREQMEEDKGRNEIALAKIEEQQAQIAELKMYKQQSEEMVQTILEKMEAQKLKYESELQNMHAKAAAQLANLQRANEEIEEVRRQRDEEREIARMAQEAERKAAAQLLEKQKCEDMLIDETDGSQQIIADLRRQCEQLKEEAELAKVNESKAVAAQIAQNEELKKIIKKQYHALNGEIGKYHTQLREAQGEANAKAAEAASLQNENKRLKDVIKEREEEIVEMSEKFELARDDIRMGEEKNSTLRAELGRLIQWIEEKIEMDAKAAEASLIHYKEEIAELKANKNEQCEEIKTLEKKLKEMSSELEVQNSTAKTATDKVKELEKKTTALKNDNKMLDKSKNITATTASWDIPTEKVKAKELEKKFENLVADKKKVEEDLDDALSKASAANQLTESLKEKISRLESDNATAKQKLEMAADERQGLQRKLFAALNGRSTADHENDSLKLDVDSKKKELEALKKEKKELMARLERAESEVVQLRSQRGGHLDKAQKKNEKDKDVPKSDIRTALPVSNSMTQAEEKKITAGAKAEAKVAFRTAKGTGANAVAGQLRKAQALPGASKVGSGSEKTMLDSRKTAEKINNLENAINKRKRDALARQGTRGFAEGIAETIPGDRRKQQEFDIKQDAPLDKPTSQNVPCAESSAKATDSQDRKKIPITLQEYKARMANGGDLDAAASGNLGGSGVTNVSLDSGTIASAGAGALHGATHDGLQEVLDRAAKKVKLASATREKEDAGKQRDSELALPEVQSSTHKSTLEDEDDLEEGEIRGDIRAAGHDLRRDAGRSEGDLRRSGASDTNNRQQGRDGSSAVTESSCGWNPGAPSGLGKSSRTGSQAVTTAGHKRPYGAISSSGFSGTNGQGGAGNLRSTGPRRNLPSAPASKTGVVTTKKRPYDSMSAASTSGASGRSSPGNLGASSTKRDSQPAQNANTSGAATGRGAGSQRSTSDQQDAKSSKGAEKDEKPAYKKHKSKETKE